MSDARRIVGVVGLYEDPAALVEAAKAFRDRGWRRWDCYTPYPIHGLDRAMGVGGSPIPYITITAAFTGAVFAKLMQWWMSAWDYPLIIGGTPLFALPAFAPVTFELFVLFAALATFACIVFLCRMIRWHSPLHEAGLMRRITSDRFALYLDASDPQFVEEGAHRALREAGCEEIHSLYEEGQAGNPQ
jgi:hypothetical protein